MEKEDEQQDEVVGVITISTTSTSLFDAPKENSTNNHHMCLMAKATEVTSSSKSIAKSNVSLMDDVDSLKVQVEVVGLYELLTNIDVGWPTVIIISSASMTNGMPYYHPKVNPLLYVGLHISPVNGILLHTPTYINAMFTSMSIDVMGARGLNPDNREAWKRRMQEKMH
jgi:hypothetical protein